MMRFSFSSIKNRLIITVILTQTVLIGLFAWDITERQQEFLKQESFELAVGTANSMTISSKPWMLSNDLAGLEEIVRSESKLPNLNFAMLFNQEGKVLAYYSNLAPDDKRVGQFVKPPQQSPDNQPVIVHDDLNVIDIISPVKVEQTLLGWSRIQINRDSLKSSIQFIQIEFSIYTAIAILFSGLIAWYMGKKLTTRIQKLINATQQIRQGEREIDLKIKGRDELGTLGNNFNAMLEDLSKNEKELNEEKKRAQITLKSIGDAVITTNQHGTIQYLNPVAVKLLGWQNYEAKNLDINRVFTIFNEQSNESVQTIHGLPSSNKGQGLTQHTVLQNRHGQKYSIIYTLSPIIDEYNQVIGSILVFHDATEEIELNKRLKWQASHDSLTQLHNRQTFENILEELIASSDDTPLSQHCLIYIDLDHFKAVNDTAGHPAGDELLRQISNLFIETINAATSIARIGGDEFAVLLKDCNIDRALKVADSLKAAINEYRFYWENRVFTIGSSLGIASVHAHTNKSVIMSQADIACYIAKEQGGNRIYVYREDDQKSTSPHQQLDWVNKIKHAIKEERFKLAVQEIVSLQNRDEGRHFEVLVRLTESGQTISPSQFLPAAEKFNLMSDLDTYIIEHAYRWLEQHSDKIELLNINISGQSISNQHFTDALLKKLQQHPDLNNKICFEITETTAITQMSDCINFLNNVKTFGCKLALDDFGSGFSTFSWLKNLPVDYVKIDGAFIRDVLSDKVDAAMVRAIHGISKEMNILSVAEFVENREICDWLIECGIDYAQGYYFAKPIDTALVFNAEVA
ncbi:EAL domain-containing protein [Thiomicrorhabdus heinhorstiae]|uniref:EAL domain-containing protein n=1 Tax=Thiomicrorhabdus heinhorstiae TaxID=2748010 RepID=A0ABS0BVL8_9GAMM|nr:EAL domain-containing protein [Thiomicrorhabdus heinhorstiae]MBF6057820.1 EAL domain-containing protein [Thiomicrorhabdus heinhorstiae]